MKHFKSYLLLFHLYKNRNRTSNLTVLGKQNLRISSSVKKFREVLKEELAVMIILFIYSFI